MGSGAFGVLQAMLPPEAMDLVALSHLHPDHCADLSGMAVYAKYRPGAAMSSLPVFGPGDIAHHLAALQYNDDPTSTEGDFRFGTWSEGAAIEVGPITITPYRVLHTVEAWGFRVTGPSDVDLGKNVVLGYSGDTDLCPGLDRLAEDVDLLLAEAAFEDGRDAARGVHLTGSRVGQLAASSGAKRVVVTHLPPWNDVAATLAQVRRYYSGPVYAARPRASYVF
jgi:ribonuclease BN (tRNA processing enzyme)